MPKRLILDNVKLVKLYSEEFSSPMLAKEFNCSVGAIISALRRNGVKIRTISKGIKLSPIHGERIRRAKTGIKLSKEHCASMSRARKGMFCGEEHWKWNPSLTEEERSDRRKNDDYRDWRDSVLGRDKYTCQVCGKVGGKLIGHHLHSYTGYKEMRFDENNGITLCEKCHISFHKQYGYRNNNASQYEEYIGAIFA